MHIVSENGSRKPESYSDAFVVLSEMGVLETATSKRMEEEAGFRNVLAYEYADIIDKEVYRHLHQLDIFETFAKQISKHYLKKCSHLHSNDFFFNLAPSLQNHSTN